MHQPTPYYTIATEVLFDNLSWFLTGGLACRGKLVRASTFTEFVNLGESLE